MVQLNMLVLIYISIIAALFGDTTSYRLTREIKTGSFILNIFQDNISTFRMANRNRPTYDQYRQLVNDIEDRQHNMAFAANEPLNSDEKIVNKFLMELKNKETRNGFESPEMFTPSRHLFDVLPNITNSDLFKFIKKVPKGGVLHAHDTALCSTDYVVSLTARENLWQYNDPNGVPKAFKFAEAQPSPMENPGNWVLVADERLKMGDEQYEAMIRPYFTLYRENPLEVYSDINNVWSAFMNIFILLDGIVTYAPVWADYYRQALTEFQADGVSYLEFRGLLPPLYDLSGHIYSPDEVVELYISTLDDFKLENPDFIGSTFIYAPLRFVDDKGFDEYLVTAKRLHKNYPNFVVGFDLVGQEDLGRPLKDFAKRLLELPESLNFYFHAAETNWFGVDTDRNIIDAIALGTKRIGHGYGIVKHPEVMKFVKEREIPLEINPISNQVLKLVDDNRNHPGSILFANNVPVVVSSDDPSFWEATPLSHDMFIYFLGIAPANADLRTIKKLAKNSIKYSSLTESQKSVALQKWTEKWNEFIQNMIKSYEYNTSSIIQGKNKLIIIAE